MAVLTQQSPGTGRPLRVFHLIKSLGRGGAEMLLTDGPRASDPSRFEYGFGYFVAKKNALVPELEAHFGPVICFEADAPAAILARATRVAAHLRSWRADLVHCHLPLAGVVGRLAGLLARVPVVYTEHNVLSRYHPATRLAAKATWPLQESVVAVSQEVATSIGRYMGHRVPVRVVRNGVAVNKFGRSSVDLGAVRARLRIEPDAPVVGTVAVFRVQKRLDLWLEVAKRLGERLPRVRYIVAGDGPLHDDVVRRIRELGLVDRVHLVGLQEDVRPYLAAMDAYLMTSDFEGIPVALLEAMSMEVVPVVTAAGGIPEVVDSEEVGYVSSKGDILGLTGACERVLAMRPEMRRAQGARARQAVVEHFSTARMMRELEQVYLSVLAES